MEIIQQFGIWVAGIGIMAFVGTKLTKVVKAFIANKKKKIINDLGKMLKDPEWKKIVFMIILKIQKDLSDVKGKERMKAAKRELLKYVPDLLDPVAEELIQAVYDELTTTKDIQAVIDKLTK